MRCKTSPAQVATRPLPEQVGPGRFGQVKAEEILGLDLSLAWCTSSKSYTSLPGTATVVCDKQVKAFSPGPARRCPPL